jgi:moderate conductance mechanosensitive channel
MLHYLDKYFVIMKPWVLDHGIRILVIFLLAIIAQRMIAAVITRTVRMAVTPKGFISKAAEEKRENTLIRIFTATLRVVLIFVAGLLILQEMGIMIAPILAGAGIIGLAFGFGGQYLIRDIISGLFIILENQYRIGDIVKFDTVGGLVEEITLRMTTLRDIDGIVHHVPHGEIKKVSNLTKEFSRVNVNIGVDYKSDLEKVIKLINQVGNKLAQDPAWSEHIISPPQFLRVDDFADSAIIIKILGDTKPSMQWDVAGELRKRLKIAFDKARVNIPFPQRDVRILKR